MEKAILKMKPEIQKKLYHYWPWLIIFSIISITSLIFIILNLINTFDLTGNTEKIKSNGYESNQKITSDKYKDFMNIVNIDSINKIIESNPSSIVKYNNLNSISIEKQIKRFLTKSIYVDLIGIHEKTPTEKYAYFRINHPTKGRINGCANFIYFDEKGWYLMSISFYNKKGESISTWDNLILPVIN